MPGLQPPVRSRVAAAGLALVMVVLALGLVWGVLSQVSTSSAHVGVARAVAARVALEAATSALNEAAALMQASVDAAGPLPDSPVDWNRTLFGALVERSAPPPRGLKVTPARTRAGVAKTVEVGEVNVDVVFTHFEPFAEPARYKPAQGLLDLSVGVTVQRMGSQVTRKVTHRRVFWAATAPVRRGVRRDPKVYLKLLNPPLAVQLE